MTEFETAAGELEQKLLVEFDVEKTNDIGYGLVEKYLRFRGEKTKYKAIVKNGQLVAIVSRKYKPVPNEELYNRLRAEGYSLYTSNGDAPYKDTRMFLRVPLSVDGFEILVVNSEDGSLVLGERLLCYGVPLKPRIIERAIKREIYRRRHVGKEDLIAQLITAMKELESLVAAHATEIKSLLHRRFEEEYVELVDDSHLTKKLKKIAKQFVGRTVFDAFTALCRVVWENKKLKPNVRNHYLKLIADLLEAIYVVETAKA